MGIEATGLKARTVCVADPEPEHTCVVTPSLEGLSVRDRLREALTCPWCRDDVQRSATSVVCSRDHCGALYHTECWDDCRELHGSCAVFGCDATEAEQVTRLGYLIRLLSLLLATILLPPRVLRAARTLEQHGFRSVFDRACAQVEPFCLSLDPGENSFAKLFAYTFAAIPVSGLLLQFLPFFRGSEAILILALPVVVGLLTLLGPTLIATSVVLAYAVCATLTRGLKKELGILGLDEPTQVDPKA